MTRLTFRRVENDTATDVSFTRADGTYCVVRVFDTSDAQTIAGQLRVLAEQIESPAQGVEYFSPWGKRKPR